MARSTRLRVLLQALRCRRHPVTAATLAQELGVSERTIYRDLSELAEQGAPVEGEAGVGYILRPGLCLPPLMLTEDETEAVLLGLRYVDQCGNGALILAAGDARAKITAVLSQAMQITIPDPNGKVFPENKALLDVLRSAIRTQKRLAIEYANGEDGASRHIVWPIQLGFIDNVRVLTGWCERGSAFRFFRTGRILSAELLDRYPARRADLVRDCQAQLRHQQASIDPHDGN